MDQTPDTPVLISDVVSLAAEYRLFLLDGAIATGSRYAIHGRLDPAPLEGDSREGEIRAFAQTLRRRRCHSLPSAVVVDIALASDPGTGRERWVVVEANMAWFAHCYAADPDRSWPWSCAPPDHGTTSRQATSDLRQRTEAVWPLGNQDRYRLTRSLHRVESIEPPLALPRSDLASGANRVFAACPGRTNQRYRTRHARAAGPVSCESGASARHGR